MSGTPGKQPLTWQEYEAGRQRDSSFSSDRSHVQWDEETHDDDGDTGHLASVTGRGSTGNDELRRRRYVIHLHSSCMIMHTHVTQDLQPP